MSPEPNPQNRAVGIVLMPELFEHHMRTEHLSGHIGLAATPSGLGGPQ